VRFFGLDPATATEKHVQTAVRARIKASTPTGRRGRRADAVVQQQRAARAYGRRTPQTPGSAVAIEAVVQLSIPARRNPLIA